MIKNILLAILIASSVSIADDGYDTGLVPGAMGSGLMKWEKGTLTNGQRATFDDAIACTINGSRTCAKDTCALLDKPSCQNICSIQRKLPAGFLDQVRIDGGSLASYVFQERQKNVNSDVIHNSLSKYREQTDVLMDLVAASTSSKSCSDFIEKTPDFQTAETYRQVRQILRDLNGKVAKTNQDFCTNLLENKSKATEILKNNLEDSRTLFERDLKNAIASMPEDQVKKEFSSMGNPSSNQYDLYKSYVESSAREALFENCLNVADVSKCLNNIREKYDQSMSVRFSGDAKKWAQFEKTLKSTPELQDFHTRLNSFDKTVKDLMQKSFKERATASLPCLKNQIAQMPEQPATPTPAPSHSDDSQN
jgi:hypothetical protein